MFTIAILAVAASLAWTAFVITGNGMAYGSKHVFEGGWMIGGAWLVTGVLCAAAILG